MLYFTCSLAQNAIDANISSRLLHAISAKILRRLRKIYAAVPKWLYDMVLKTSAYLRETLEARWRAIEATYSTSPLWSPSQLDLDIDMQLSLLASLKYIHSSLAGRASEPRKSPFFPKVLPRGTLDDFLSSNGMFFEEACKANPYVALFDVEQAVEQGIDDWVACVTDVDQACIQLEIMMDKYLTSARHTYHSSPEHISLLLLTTIEFWVALDKIVVAAIPMVANYSPEIPTTLLHTLLLNKTVNLCRLRRAYQYLSTRHSQCHPGNSIFSDEFTTTMFPVRCSTNSPHLRSHIEEYGPTVPSHANIVVFELRCPVPLHIWRSFTARLLGSVPTCTESHKGEGECLLPVQLANISRLQPFLVSHSTSPATSRVYLTCLFPTGLQLLNMVYPSSWTGSGCSVVPDTHLVYGHPSDRRLHRYTNATSHTSNGVLVAQAKHTGDLSSLEFIAFGHLRSGGSLQLLNILGELRSRTLNFRRHDVYLLLNQAASHVGPFNPDTTDWLWHQELQELTFCRTLLHELQSLFADVAVHSSNDVMMSIIAFLLTRLLLSCCYEDIADQAIRLLRQVRTKTFEWVQELSYSLLLDPTNTEQSKLMRDMATTCRSTFDVAPVILHKLLYSAEDVDALISCAIFIHVHSFVGSNKRTSNSWTRDYCTTLFKTNAYRHSKVFTTTP